MSQIEFLTVEKMPQGSSLTLPERRMYRNGIAYAQKCADEINPKQPLLTPNELANMVEDRGLIDAYLRAENNALAKILRSQNDATWLPISRRIGKIEEYSWKADDHRFFFRNTIASEKHYEAYKFALELRARFTRLFERHPVFNWHELFASVHKPSGYSGRHILGEHILEACLEIIICREPEFKVRGIEKLDKLDDVAMPTNNAIYEEIADLRYPHRKRGPIVATDIRAVKSAVDAANAEVRQIKAQTKDLDILFECLRSQNRSATDDVAVARRIAGHFHTEKIVDTAILQLMQNDEFSAAAISSCLGDEPTYQDVLAAMKRREKVKEFSADTVSSAYSRLPADTQGVKEARLSATIRHYLDADDCIRAIGEAAKHVTNAKYAKLEMPPVLVSSPYLGKLVPGATLRRLLCSRTNEGKTDDLKVRIARALDIYREQSKSGDPAFDRFSRLQF